MHWFAETREDYSTRWLRAMARAFPERWRAVEGQAPSAVLVKRAPTPERVTVIISGGGSNGPFIPGFVGEGLADAAVVGPPYAAPSAYALYETGRALAGEKGVLLLYNNFMGDYLNNDMAAELLRLDGISVEQVRCCDDMGLAIGEPRENRGGRVGIAYPIKICAEAARQGRTLAEVAGLARKAERRMATLSLVVEPEANRVSFGNGFSGEPGFRTLENANVAAAAEETIRMLWDDVKPRTGEKVFMMVNYMRLTSYSDAYVMAGSLFDALAARTADARMAVGTYQQALDSYGYTVTLLCADGQLQPYLEGTVSGDGFLL